GFQTELEVVEGMEFDRGYSSPYMVTDQDKMEAVLEEPYILITDKKIGNIQEVLPVLEEVVQQGKPLLIIAEDVEGDRKSTRLNSSHVSISYAVFCLKKKIIDKNIQRRKWRKHWCE